MAGGGGAWKVAYADFVTAMMAFFMVMWLISQNQKIKGAVALHFREPDPFSVFKSTESGNASGREKRAKKPYGKSSGSSQDEVPDDPTMRRSRAGVRRESIRSGISTAVVFTDEQVELDDQGKKRLEKFLPQIAGKRHKIEVRGYLSRRPLPEDTPFKTNWDVCFARCQAVMKVLEQHGVSEDLIRLNLAGAIETESNRNDAEWQGRNSRVEVTVLDEVVKLNADKGED